MKTISIPYTRVFDKLIQTPQPIIVCVGGARSSKSYSIAQLFIKRLLEEENKNFLILRKTRPSLKLSTYKLFMDLLHKYEIFNRKNLNMSDLIYRHNTNYVVFTSIDDPEKIKSTEWNYIWLEEANEFTYDDFIVLKLRLSGKTDTMNQMILSKNPVDELGWIHQRLEKEPDVAVITSTHKDNPFISDEYRKILYDLKDTDLTFYKIYTLGEYAQLSNLIYTNWDIIEQVPDSFDEVIYAIDFGFNNPNALLKLGIKDSEYYLSEQLYQTHMTNQDLIEEFKDLIKPKSDVIYADSAEPARIEEISKAGFDVHAANKSVKDGIDYVKSQKLHIDKNSVNLISEIRTYKYKEDRNGNVLEDPVKFRDHLMDGMRYALYTYYLSIASIKTAIPNYYIPDLSHTPIRGRHL
jgi:phage terminase large subunit